MTSNHHPLPQSIINRHNTHLLLTLQVRGDLPIAGLDPLDEYLLKKMDIMTACGPTSSMYFTLEGAPSDGLLCAMRVHLMSDPELAVFCPEQAHAWEQQCQQVLLDPSMAVSEGNERAVLQTLSKAVEQQLDAYPGSKADDVALLARLRTRGAINDHTHAAAAIQLRHNEKAILEAAISHLQRRLGALKRGEVRAMSLPLYNSTLSFLPFLSPFILSLSSLHV